MIYILFPFQRPPTTEASVAADNASRNIELMIEEICPPRATELAPGVTLITRDGSACGNAIIIQEVQPGPLVKDYLQLNGQKMWLIETDFGNQMRLCDNEIYEMFSLGYQQTYDTWWDERLETIESSLRSLKGNPFK